MVSAAVRDNGRAQTPDQGAWNCSGKQKDLILRDRRGAQAGEGQGRRSGPGTLWQDGQGPQQTRSIRPHRRAAGDDGAEQRPESFSRPVSESRWAMIAAVDSVQVHPPAQATPKAKANPIETLQKTVSASRLTTFLQCRLKFYFRYVQQISKPKTPSLHVGSVVHLILQAWNMARWRRQEFSLERFKKLFEEGWKDQPAEDQLGRRGRRSTRYGLVSAGDVLC